MTANRLPGLFTQMQCNNSLKGFFSFRVQVLYLKLNNREQNLV